MTLPRGALRLSVSTLGSFVSAGHDEPAGPHADELRWHDLALWFGELRVHGALALTSWLQFDVLASLRVVYVDFELQDAARRPVPGATAADDIHHRTETLVGLGDPWLSLRAARALGPFAVAVRAGLTLPVGRTEENPFRLGREGRAHQHVQLGTGTVDPFVEAQVRWQGRRAGVDAWLLGRAPLYANPRGFRAGSQLLVGARASSGLGLQRFAFAAGVILYNEEPERWDGRVETEGNLGRTDLLVETSVTWRPAGPWSVTAGARLPVWSRTVGGQLSSPALLDVGVSRTFDLWR